MTRGSLSRDLPLGFKSTRTSPNIKMLGVSQLCSASLDSYTAALMCGSGPQGIHSPARQRCPPGQSHPSIKARHCRRQPEWKLLPRGFWLVSYVLHAFSWVSSTKVASCRKDSRCWGCHCSHCCWLRSVQCPSSEDASPGLCPALCQHRRGSAGSLSRPWPSFH